MSLYPNGAEVSFCSTNPGEPVPCHDGFHYALHSSASTVMSPEPMAGLRCTCGAYELEYRICRECGQEYAYWRGVMDDAKKGDGGTTRYDEFERSARALHTFLREKVADYDTPAEEGLVQLVSDESVSDEFCALLQGLNAALRNLDELTKGSSEC